MWVLVNIKIPVSPSILSSVPIICLIVWSNILSFAVGLMKLIITSNKILDNKVTNLNFNNFRENIITKIADKFILKKAALSPLKKINTSDKIKVKINKKNNLSFCLKINIDKPKRIGQSLLI